MVKLYETGAYLLDGEKLIPDDGSAAGRENEMNERTVA